MVKVISVEPAENYRLRIVLSNNRKGVFDVTPYLGKGIFTELRDEAYFRRVRAAHGGVMWPHEQDFSAETIEHELQRLHSSEKVSA